MSTNHWLLSATLRAEMLHSVALISTLYTLGAETKFASVLSPEKSIGTQLYTHADVLTSKYISAR